MLKCLIHDVQTPCLWCLRDSPYNAQPVSEPEPSIDYHALWHSLHTEVRTAEQFADWVKRVPSWGCSCSSWLREYVAANPPAGDLREYGFYLHCAVNAKLSKPEFSWEQFEEKYPD